MAKEVFMPKLSSTMEVGTLLQWLKDEGDTVEMGEPLFEIMTDKINIEVESYEEGVLLKKYYEVDDEVPINTVIGYIGETNEKVPDAPPLLDDEKDKDSANDSGSSAQEDKTYHAERAENKDKVRATPAARRVAREKGVSLTDVTGSGPKGRIYEEDVERYTKENEILISPLAQRMAEENNIDLNDIRGTGFRGKIEKVDIENYLSKPKQDEGIRIKMKGLRKVVADKMSHSSQSIPHVTLTSKVDMTQVMEIRKQLLPIVEQQTDLRLSFTEIIIKLTSYTLGKHPTVNASFVDNEIIMNEQINIGLAVAVYNGLIVPSIHQANQKGLSVLTQETKELGTKAREGKLTPDEMEGSTFTISNLGMYAIDGFTPIINPPETAILGVGQISEEPVVINGEIKIRPMMVLSLSFDHRVIDGAPAAAFLTDLKNNFQNPFNILV